MLYFSLQAQTLVPACPRISPQILSLSIASASCYSSSYSCGCQYVSHAADSRVQRPTAYSKLQLGSSIHQLCGRLITLKLGLSLMSTTASTQPHSDALPNPHLLTVILWHTIHKLRNHEIYPLLA